MKSAGEKSLFSIWLRELRAPFFTAGIIPVLVGSASGYAQIGCFDPVLFVLAMMAIVALHAGANLANDYFDHRSGNDWLTVPTPFSGGSQCIQQGLLAPSSVLIACCSALLIGAVTGAVILLMTRSVFILILGLLGLLGGYFYTAPPVKLVYRGFGELAISALFGVLPVYGAYYLQTKHLDLVPVLPGLIVSMLIFLVILANEFPDISADRAVNKNTLVVLLGSETCRSVYKAVLLCCYFLSIAGMLFVPRMFYPCVFFTITLPVGFLALRYLGRSSLENNSLHGLCGTTILLHLVGGLALACGFVVSALFTQ